MRLCLWKFYLFFYLPPILQYFFPFINTLNWIFEKIDEVNKSVELDKERKIEDTIY